MNTSHVAIGTSSCQSWRLLLSSLAGRVECGENGFIHLRHPGFIDEKSEMEKLTHIPVWIRWFRFNFAGLLGMLVQMTFMMVATRLFGMNYLLATAIGVECALLHNFIWHELYTWQEQKLNRALPNVLGRLLRFNFTVGAFSILGNIIFMRLLAGSLKLPLLVATLLTIAILSLGNFLISEYHIFSEPVATSH